MSAVAAPSYPPSAHASYSPSVQDPYSDLRDEIKFSLMLLRADVRNHIFEQNLGHPKRDRNFLVSLVMGWDLSAGEPEEGGYRYERDSVSFNGDIARNPDGSLFLRIKHQLPEDREIDALFLDPEGRVTNISRFENIPHNDYDLYTKAGRAKADKIVDLIFSGLVPDDNAPISMYTDVRWECAGYSPESMRRRCRDTRRSIVNNLDYERLAQLELEAPLFVPAVHRILQHIESENCFSRKALSETHAVWGLLSACNAKREVKELFQKISKEQNVDSATVWSCWYLSEGAYSLSDRYALTSRLIQMFRDSKNYDVTDDDATEIAARFTNFHDPKTAMLRHRFERVWTIFSEDGDLWAYRSHGERIKKYDAMLEGSFSYIWIVNDIPQFIVSMRPTPDGKTLQIIQIQGITEIAVDKSHKESRKAPSWRNHYDFETMLIDLSAAVAWEAGFENIGILSAHNNQWIPGHFPLSQGLKRYDDNASRVGMKQQPNKDWSIPLRQTLLGRARSGRFQYHWRRNNSKNIGGISAVSGASK